MPEAPQRGDRPPKTREVYRGEFEQTRGSGAVERFISACRTGLLRNAAAAFNLGRASNAWWWYCHLTGERRVPRQKPSPVQRPTRHGRRHDITAELILHLASRGMGIKAIIKELKASTRTIYRRVRSIRVPPKEAPPPARVS